MQTAHIRNKLIRGESLRVLFINDIGFQYGAGILNRRQVQSFLIAGHEVMGLCWDQLSEEGNISFIPDRVDGTWCGIRELSHVHRNNGLNESQIIDEIIKVVVDFAPDVIIVGNLHRADWPLSLFLSLKELDCLVVAYMHDCYLVSGRCVYPGECSLYLVGCNETCPTADQYPVLEPEKIPNAWALRRQLFCGPGGIPIVTNSYWTLQVARKALKGLRHVDVVYGGLDTELFKRIDPSLARRLSGIPDDGRIIILSGACDVKDERKGGSIFFTMVEKLSKDSRVHLVVFGGHALGLKNAQGIDYIRDYRKMPLLYSAADIFVGTSIEEAFGQTFCEAAACSIPVVGFNVGGVGESVRHDINAKLSNEISVDALMEEIEFFIENPDKREEFGHRGREVVEEEFSLERQAQRWTAYIEGLISHFQNTNSHRGNN